MPLAFVSDAPGRLREQMFTGSWPGLVAIAANAV